MSRVKEFDPDEVLDRALALFWERGYEATSVADLVERLGIGRASLYATFGTKRDLYLKSLDRYCRTRSPDPVEVLSQPGPVLPAVRRVVELYAEQAAQDQARRGCMVINAAVETAAGDPAVARLVGRSWQAIEVALIGALTRARAQGELAEDRDPRALAQFLLVLLQGIRVVGKADPDPDRVRAAADQALAVLQ
jgi:TetR/AcrR family transcriptional regulator, transcriptional repressor for nem operon